MRSTIQVNDLCGPTGPKEQKFAIRAVKRQDHAYHICESLTQVKISRFGARGWHQDAMLWQASFGTGLIRRNS